MAHEAKRKRFDKDLESLKSDKVEGLEDLIFEIKNLKKSNIYKNLYKAFNLRGNILAPGTTAEEIRSKSSLIKIARANLRNPQFYFHPLTDLINFKMFYVMYTFLETIYFMNLGRKLEDEDLKYLYSSGLDEKIIYALDEFEKISDVPKLTSTFFIMLKKITWLDKETKRFFKEFHEVMVSAGAEIFGYSLDRFRITEKAFLLTLSGYSAVNDGRDKINKKDVVKAYKTYFKLIRTDITKYKAKPEIFDLSGFLVCDKCNEYYQLQPGESPDDFTGQCECGGKLKFYENIDWLLEGGGDVEVDD